MGILIKHDFGYFGGRQSVDNEGRGIGIPRNDVDALALQFLNNGLDAKATPASPCTDGIDAGILADYSNLGARARITRHRANFDDAIVYFWDFLREQPNHELRVTARKEDLRPTCLAAHIVNIRSDTVTRTKRLPWNHF